jgi:2-C-methyl-D-erythritol 4-phosphate cytidylyltransferase
LAGLEDIKLRPRFFDALAPADQIRDILDRIAMKVSIIIVAAGSGSRLGKSEPKAFVPVAGRPMLFHTLRTIAGLSEVVEAVIAVPAGMESHAREVCREAAIEMPVKITAGGAERQDSVRIALALTSVEADVVAVHDAARPLAGAELFERCIAGAARTGAAIAAMPVSDTLKREGSDRIIAATVARAGLWSAQTPQAFRRGILVAAHERAARDAVAATDDADLVERLGGRVELIESSSRNIKITTASDLEIAEAIFERKS